MQETPITTIGNARGAATNLQFSTSFYVFFDDRRFKIVFFEYLAELFVCLEQCKCLQTKKEAFFLASFCRWLVELLKLLLLLNPAHRFKHISANSLLC